MSVVNVSNYLFGFSMCKQSGIAAHLASANINKMRPSRGFAPINMDQVRISDRMWAGKGTPFATMADRITKQYRINGQERSATALDLLWASWLVMGAISSSQPSSALAEYQHIVTFADTSTVKETIYTAVGEIMGAEYSKKLTGAWLNSMTITGDRGDHVRLSFEGGGRYYGDDALANIPTSPTASKFLKTLYGNVYLAAAPTLTGIDAQVLSFNLTLTQNAQPLYLLGNSSGDEMLLGKVLIGRQAVSGSITLFISSTFRNFFLNDTLCRIRLILKSAENIVSNPYSCIIDVPECYVASEGFATEGDSVAYTFNISEDTVMKSATSGTPVTLTHTNDITTTGIGQVG